MTTTSTECKKSTTDGWSAVFTANQDAINNRLGNRTFPYPTTKNITYALGNASYVINPGGDKDILQVKLTVTLGSWGGDPAIPSAWGSHTTKTPMLMGEYKGVLYLTFLDESGVLYTSTNTGGEWTSLEGVSSTWSTTLTLSKSVSICSYKDETFFMVLVDDSGKIYTSTLDGNQWAEPVQLWSDVTTSFAVTMAYNDTDETLYMALSQKNDDNKDVAYYATYNGTAWSTPTAIFSDWPGGVVQDAMSLAMFQDTLYLGIRAIDTKARNNNDQTISKFYQAAYKDGWSSSPTKRFSAWANRPGESAAYTPYLAGTSSRLYVTYVTDKDKDNLYLANASTGVNWTGQPQIAFSDWDVQLGQGAPLATYNNTLYVSCSDQSGTPYIEAQNSEINWGSEGFTINSFTSDQAVAYAVFNDLFYLAYVDSNKTIQISTSQDGFAWNSSAQSPFSDFTTAIAVNMVVFNNSLYLCAVKSADSYIYVASLSGGGSWTSLTQAITDNSPTTALPVAIGAVNDSTMIMALVKQSDSKVYLATSTDGSAWSLVTLPLFGGVTTAQAVNLEYFNNRMYMAVLNGSSQICIPSSTDGTSWPSALTAAFSSFKSNLSASLTVFAGQLYVGAVDTDGNIYTASSTSGGGWPSSPKQILTSATSRTQVTLAEYSNLLYASYITSGKVYGAASGGLSLTNIDVSLIELVGVYQDFFVDYTDPNGVPTVDCGSWNGSFEPNNGFTFQTWVYVPNTATGKQTIFVVGNSDIKLTLGAHDKGSNEYNHLTFTWGGTSVTGTQDSRTIADGNWHHLAVTVTYADSTYSVTFYKDGRADSKSYTLSSPSSVSGNLRLGSSSDNDPNPFAGYLTQVAIWDTTLSSQQIQLYLNCDLTQLSAENFYSNLRGYWSFSKGSSSTNLVGSDAISPSGVSFYPDDKGTGTSATVFLNFFDVSPKAQNLLPKVEVYINGSSNTSNTSAVSWLRSSVAEFAEQTLGLTLTSKTQYLAMPSVMPFLTVGNTSDSTQSQLFIPIMLNNSAPPGTSFSSLMSFSAITGTNNLLVLCDYSFWTDVVLPKLAISLKGNASDFEVTTDEPPVLQLVKSIDVPLGPITLTITTLKASIPNNSSPTVMPQQVIASNADMTFNVGTAKAATVKVDVPVYVAVTDEPPSDSKATSQKEVSKYKWSLGNIIFTVLFAILLAIGTTAALFYCLGTIPSNPYLLLGLSFVFAIIWGIILYLIARKVINMITVDHSPKASTDNETRYLEISSDAKVTIILEPVGVAIVVAIIVALSVVGAVFYWRAGGVCLYIYVVFVLIMLGMYVFYWLATLGEQYVETFIENAINKVIDQDVTLDGVGAYTLLGILAQDNSLKAYGEMSASD